MGKFEFILPAMGEGIIEATVTRWFVNVGAQIRKDDPLVEVATDKVDSEIPSPAEGIISKIIYHEGEIPKIGEVLAVIETDLSVSATDDVMEVIPEESVPLDADSNSEIFQSAETVPIGLNMDAPKSISNELTTTPFIKFLAKSREISHAELVRIKGSGLGGRITKEDLHRYITRGRPCKSVGNGVDNYSIDLRPATDAANEGELYVPGENEELIPMDRTRKLIAEHMVRSKKTSPHVTSMVEIDVTAMVQWRENNKGAFSEKHGIKLTYTPFIIYTVVKALKQYPGINISVAGDKIIRKKNINIGVATALPDGNLVVPVIHDADKRSFVNIALSIHDLASRSREGKLLPVEVKGGTFTITNMGQYGNVSGTPIINQPEVAILAVGAIKKKPAVVNIENQLSIGIRDIMILSLTYDHRVVDGALGGSFVRDIGKILENEFPDF
jgi:2-oxoglutarate dehydrogenase E2 component (dihydrolipoamide succinyltransferase)